MPTRSRRTLALCAGLLLLGTGCPLALIAQQTNEIIEGPNPNDKDPLKNLKFRNLGPAIAGGRVTAVAGVPGDPNIYYVGAAGGGIYKTTDGGTTWTPIFQKEATASIGDLALAPSNPNLIWVGTGEANIRNDITDGAGVYFSPDAGHSWRFMGLKNAGQISRVLVDPHNANTVFVGAIGHAWAPNPERGVFRTTDGGKTWKKVLFVDDQTGVADLAMQPGNPNVLYATMWHVRRYPWTLINGGESSGIYRSTDGGDSWHKLTEGLPPGPWGRCAVAVAPSNPSHLYALIDAKKGLLWQSTDMGEHWTAVSDNHALDVRPFYFSRMAVSPLDENKIYFLSFDLMESDDGGKTAHIADGGVHPDHHAIWIDPQNPNRIIQGNDGGAFLTLNGKSWRFLDNLPIEQFYQVAKNSKVPYTLCGGLQDNNAWCGPSSDLGRKGVTNADWYSVVGGDGEYAVPAPSDPNLIYADAQDGFIERVVNGTHVSHFARPYLEGAEEMAPSALKYRFNWTSPIAVSRTNADEVYLGANVLFRSMDGGKNWTAISGDLTRDDKSKQMPAGEPISHDLSGAENYDTIQSIGLASTDANVIWVGTDDGNVQLTRDGGQNWTNLTSRIPGAPAWARVYQIGVSPFDAGTAYLSFDAHMLDDRHAYVYKTTDYGQSWRNISAGLPDSPVFVVREDPNVRGLLVLGNDQGLFSSHDAGEHWTALKANFPTAPVWDLQFDKDSRDLIVATHGRGLFVFDDLRPIEQWRDDIESQNLHVFNAGTGLLLHHWESDEDNPVSFSAPNAPTGVPIDYFLKTKLEATPEQKQKHETPAKIVVTDSEGHLVATHYGPTNAGINRYVWDLRYTGTRRLLSAIPPESPVPGEQEETRYYTRGPLVLPGQYNIAVTVNGQTEKTAATVRMDPNLHPTLADVQAQTRAAMVLRNDLIAVNDIIERIDAMRKQIADFRTSIGMNEQLEQKYAPLLQQAKQLDDKLKSVEASVYNPDIQHNVEEDDIHAFSDFEDEVQGLAGMLASEFDQPPNAQMREKIAEIGKELQEHIGTFNALLKDQVAGYNKAALASGAPSLFASDPVSIEPLSGALSSSAGQR